MQAERSVEPRPSVPFSCLPQLLERHAKRIPDAPAILAPKREPLTYRRLYQHVDEIGHTLRAMGISRHDRIAIVLPNGPEMAVAFLAVASNAVCVPLNPAYGIDELNTYFLELRPRALITQAGIDSPARRTARARGVRVIDLPIASELEAGLFALTGDHSSASTHEEIRPGDVALLLLTSGTTSRPKVVPLTHANLCASACSTVAALALTETDRCMNVVPLFHGHGLNNTLLASLAAGASIVCTTGCDVNSFFAWLSDFRPTWYSAVPAMHQAILAKAQHDRERAVRYRLRLIRSSSAPLLPSVFEDLERTFETSVIEAYGMTEVASSPIACNPLPPLQRKVGSVGVPVDLNVAILDERGAVLSRGRTGEIVVHGASVMAGYDGDPIATQAAFAGEWFKTGDLGFFDDDGYLFLTGRVRETINRGGEKVAPQEIDEVLLKHPAVAEAVTFPIPHATLGEDVATAVVLQPHRVATPSDIRQFAVGKVADFKVPRQVVIVEQIPRGPTGKVQRMSLAATLGLATDAGRPRGFVAPRTPLEVMLAKQWAEILQVEQIGIHDDFFAIGGDSLLATLVLLHIYETTQIELDVSRFFESPTVAEVAQHLEASIRANRSPQTQVIARVPRKKGVAPASIAQERLWKLQEALPDIPFCNIVYALRLMSPVEASVLERAINEIVHRHETLRTTFDIVRGRRVQVIAPRLNLRLRCDDLHELRRSRKETLTHQLIQKELLHRFDLARGPLVRVRLVRLTTRTHLLLISMHQMIQDGWSLGIFMDELTKLYDAFVAGAPSPLASLPIQYADFAHWQRRWRSDPAIVAQLDYWRERLSNPLPVMRLATANARPTAFDLRTARRRVALPLKISEAAKRFSQQEGVTLFMTLLTAFKILLHRYSYEDDVRVATHIANRNRPGTSGLIGPFVNTAVLRTDLGGDPSAREVLGRVRATTVAAFANQDIPFEEVVEALERERGLEPAALAQYMMWLQNTSLRPILKFRNGLAWEEIDPGMLLPLVTITTFDVMLMLRESTGGLVGTCVYNPQLFGARAVDRLLRNFQKVLDHVVRHPERPISAMPVSLNEISD